MRLIDAVKSLLGRIVRNVAAIAERLTNQEVTISPSGEITVKEPAIKSVADKLSAVIVASAALFFLLSPVQGKVAMSVGDQLLRAATMLWSGTTPAAEFAT